MNREQIYLVKKTFKKIAPISEQAAALFYAKLFDLDPKLQGLFKGDVREQGRKLMQVISYAVDNLERIDEIVPQVRALGARHAGYGVEERDYDAVGMALLWTLEKALSLEFTTEAKEAWAALYELLAETMKEAARQKTENSSHVVFQRQL